MIKFLGVDWGEKRIGLSLADNENFLATPFKTISSPRKLVDLVKGDEIKLVVVGSPRKMNGMNDFNLRYLSFVEFLKKELGVTGVDIVLFDERLSSVQADSIMNKKINNNRDSLAAMIILQSYLEVLKNDKNKSNSFKQD